MNIQELSEAMTDISDEYIEETYNYQRASVFDFKKALSAVATISVLVKKQIKSDYLSYSQSDMESKDFDIIYCGTYNGNIAFKVILKDGQNGGNTISEGFADPNGKFSFLTLNYKENEPILLWSEKEKISTLTQNYDKGTLNYEQVFSIWYWILIETEEVYA